MILIYSGLIHRPSGSEINMFAEQTPFNTSMALPRGNLFEAVKKFTKTQHYSILITNFDPERNRIQIMSDKSKSLFKEHSKISPCFSHLNEEDLEYLDTKVTQLTYFQGENLFKQGAFAPYVLYVIDGATKIYLQTGYDKQLNIRLAVSGDFLAFSAVFGSSVYNYSSQALMDTTVCMIDKEALKEVLLRNPDFAMQLTSLNYKNEETLLKLIGSLSYKQMRGKLATSLLYLSSEEFLKLNIFKYLSRQEIADFAAVTTESTIKLLKEFEKEAIIKLEGKEIHILEKGRLEEISRKG